MQPIIGIDFDSTIAKYDQLMHEIALEKGFIRPEVNVNKKDIRDYIRQLEDGETKWQIVQSTAYGPRMKEARLAESFHDFYTKCKKSGIKTYIISHKTVHAKYDATRTNLRKAAIEWILKQGLFSSAQIDQYGHPNIFFESSREEKIERITFLKCTHFIDDLPEVFTESLFPRNIEKILYDPFGHSLPMQDVKVFSSWKAIEDYFFQN